jgi:hypothetical protein
MRRWKRKMFKIMEGNDSSRNEARYGLRAFRTQELARLRGICFEFSSGTQTKQKGDECSAEEYARLWGALRRRVQVTDLVISEGWWMFRRGISQEAVRCTPTSPVDGSGYFWGVTDVLQRNKPVCERHVVDSVRNPD